MFVHMGPSHPAMHGVIHMTLELDGETIVDGDTEIGYLHRAFEKEAESHTYTQVIPYTDRLNYVSPLINNVGFVLAVEKLFDVETPERCQYIRVLVSELSRITDHLTCIAANAMELGAFHGLFLLHQGARRNLEAGRGHLWRPPDHDIHPRGRRHGRPAGGLRGPAGGGSGAVGRADARRGASVAEEPHLP